MWIKKTLFYFMECLLAILVILKFERRSPGQGKLHDKLPYIVKPSKKDTNFPFSKGELAINDFDLGWDLTLTMKPSNLPNWAQRCTCSD